MQQAMNKAIASVKGPTEFASKMELIELEAVRTHIKIIYELGQLYSEDPSLNIYGKSKAFSDYALEIMENQQLAKYNQI